MAKELEMRFFYSGFPDHSPGGSIGSVTKVVEGDDDRDGIYAIVVPHVVRGFAWVSFTNGSDGWHYRHPLSLDAARRAVQAHGFFNAQWMDAPFAPTERCPFESPSAEGEVASSSASLVYFVQAGNEHPIKIGTTSDLDRRLMQLQMGCPTDLVVIGTLPGGPAEEEEWHARFENLRVRGEWFRADERLLTAIEEVTRAPH